MNLDELISEAGQAAGDIGNAVSEAVRGAIRFQGDLSV